MLKWVEEQVWQLPTLVESLLPKERGDVLELDEAWSFVCQRWNKRWLWTALCHRTRQIIGFAIGQRDEAACRHHWQSSPPAYRRCRSYSDFLKAYQVVLPKRTHHLGISYLDEPTVVLEVYQGTARRVRQSSVNTTRNSPPLDIQHFTIENLIEDAADCFRFCHVEYEPYYGYPVSTSRGFIESNSVLISISPVVEF